MRMSDDVEIKRNEETGEVEGTQNDSRLALLEKLADNAETDRQDDLVNVNDDNTTEPFRKEAAPTEEPETPPAPEPEAKKFKLKVDGEELEVTEEELIARAQKVSAADKYLAEAAAARRAATQPEPPRGPTQEELQRLQDDEDLKLVRAIQMGTETEAAAALRKIREAASAARPSISPDDVARTIDQRLAFNEAINRFRTDYSDIVGDPYLNKMAQDMDVQLIEAGDRRDYGDRYAEIGKKIRAWKDSLSPRQEAKTLQEKEDRKASAPKAPISASAKTRAPEAEDDGEDDPREVISSMRKHRGGPQWMRG